MRMKSGHQEHVIIDATNDLLLLISAGRPRSLGLGQNNSFLTRQLFLKTCRHQIDGESTSPYYELKLIYKLLYDIVLL